MTTEKMQNLYVRLERAGIPKNYVRSYILPDWWDDEIAESSTGFLEGLGYVAKYLDIDVATLRNPDTALSAPNVAGARFKLRANVETNDVTWSQSLAVRTAEMAAFATDTPYTSLETETAGSIRRAILDRGASWISLENLLDYCWENGVPVLHVPQVPGKKMDAIVVHASDRPAIVLSIDHKHDAWMLFILAHELGHIVHQHVGDEGVHVDEEYSPQSDDPQERAANRFAVELLTGDPDCKFGIEGNHYPKAPTFAESVKQFGKSENVSPGVAVLNFAHNDSGKPWPLANATLNILNPNPDAPGVIRSALVEHLSWAKLPDESTAFMSRLVGLDQVPNTDQSTA